MVPVLVHSWLPVQPVDQLQQLICRDCPAAGAVEGQVDLEHRHAQGLRELWGPFLCSHRLLEGCFTALPEHAPVMESGADCLYIPEDCSAMAGAEDVMLTTHQEAAMGVAAAFEVVLRAAQSYCGCRRSQPSLK